MQAFELTELISQRADSNRLYLEFLKVPDLSMGLYVLPAGGTDPQSPHTEDEVYYVVSGRAKIRVADDDRPVQAGSIVSTSRKLKEFPKTGVRAYARTPVFGLLLVVS